MKSLPKKSIANAIVSLAVGLGLFWLSIAHQQQGQPPAPVPAQAKPRRIEVPTKDPDPAQKKSTIDKELPGMATVNALAGSCSNVGTGDTWTDLGNITAEDSSNVNVSLVGGTSKRLRVVGFGFSLPDGSTVNGITVRIRRRTFSIGGAADSVIQLTSGGSALGDNKSAGASWPIILANATFGGSSDEWGRTWSVAEVNASDFGVDIVCTGSNDAAVDVVEITLDYTLGSSFDPASDMSWMSEPSTNVTLYKRSTRAIPCK